MIAEEMNVVIPMASFKDYDYLKISLKSLADTTKFNYDLKIHLNTYDDDTQELAAKYDPGYTKSSTNLGISEAINICVARSNADYIFIADSGLVFLPGWDTALVDGMNKYGVDNVLSVTKVEPHGHNPACIIKNYGDDHVSFRYDELLRDVESLKRDEYQFITCAPCLMPIHLHVPFDERYFPGWVTDDEMYVNAWHIDNEVRFIKSWKSLIYHFPSKASGKVGTHEQKHAWSQAAIRMFNEKWKKFNINHSNYRGIIVK